MIWSSGVMQMIRLFIVCFLVLIFVQMTLIWTVLEQPLCARKDAPGRTRRRVQHLGV
tara:strand:+ start:183 stop:353 length:171 start_codon:yes stop_codon:yes gene_type:complete